jgi:hypothetical protein
MAAERDSAARSGKATRGNLRFLSAYLDRESAPLRKTFHRVALQKDLWFTNEPDLLVRLLPNRES